MDGLVVLVIRTISEIPACTFHHQEHARSRTRQAQRNENKRTMNRFNHLEKVWSTIDRYTSRSERVLNSEAYGVAFLTYFTEHLFKTIQGEPVGNNEKEVYNEQRSHYEINS